MSGESIVIVGAGHAGGCAAAALRSAGFAGRITLIGKEIHLPYERPPLSKGVLSGEADPTTLFLRAEDWYSEAQVDLQLDTHVVEIVPGRKVVVSEDGKTFSYDKLLLTTGARARKLTVGGDAGPDIIYLRGIDDTFLLRGRLTEERKIAIIGAGFIGLEIGATATKLGCAVEVFEASAGPMGRVMPKDIGDIVVRLHSARGVHFRFHAEITSIHRQGSGYLIELANGESVEADVVIAGIGAVPNDELAAEAGLAVSDGIIVDEFGRTSDPSIFAAGDVTRHYNPLLKRQIRLEAWQNAQNQANAVANVMAGRAVPFAEVPWLWTDQFDMNLQIAGHPMDWDRLIWRGDPDEGHAIAFQLVDGIPVGAISINNAREMRFARQLIAKAIPVDPRLLADKSCKLQELCR
ncbi:MAG: FAD-dependent oxidoreductase [Proteobacteria bacterium]|nr:FAD-dependent oxidoreductase [Pseudomonadota bacterium]